MCGNLVRGVRFQGVRIALLGWHTGSRRHIVLMSGTKKRSRLKDRLKTTMEKRLEAEAKEWETRVQHLKQLSQELKQEMELEKKKKEMQEHFKDGEMSEEDMADAEVIYNELKGPDLTLRGLPAKDMTTANVSALSTRSHSGGLVQLFDTTAGGINIPSSMKSKIGNNIVHIVDKDSQNWDPIIEDLYHKKRGFKRVPKYDAANFAHQIPVGTISSRSLELLNEMLVEKGVTYDQKMYDLFLRHFAELNKPAVVEAFYQEAIYKGLKPTVHTFGHLIKAFSKAEDVKKVNSVLKEMVKRGIEPNTVIYTNAIQLSRNLGDFDQALEIFETMKFRSQATQPDLQTYNSMILLAAKDDNVYKAIDIYNELLDLKLVPDVFTFNTLAHACSKSNEFIIQGWKFMNEIGKRNLHPNVHTFEAMLRLSAKDGDLELARALYFTIVEASSTQTPATNSEAFLYLLMAYKSYNSTHIPQLLNYEEGASVRRNTIGLVDYSAAVLAEKANLNQRAYPPFLPVKRLGNRKQIVAEAKALWAFNVLQSPEILNDANLVSFLMVLVEHGAKQDFLEAFEQYTYVNEELAEDSTQVTEVEEVGEGEVETDWQEDRLQDEHLQTEHDTPYGEPQKQESKDSLVPTAIKRAKEFNIKIERNSSLYTCFIVAGRKFDDMAMCERAWKERGRYRKTKAFKASPHYVKDASDYQFAKEMILSLTNAGLLSDAMKLVRSTENQFNWDFYALRPLYDALNLVGSETEMKEVSIICNKSKGKIVRTMKNRHSRG